MKSLDRVRAEIKSFLGQDEARVLAIKGAWGVGKTFLWNAIVAEKPRVSKCVAYSYVSLFGLQTLAELRHALFSRQQEISSTEVQTQAFHWPHWLKRPQRRIPAALRHFELNGIPIISLKNTDVWADAIEDRYLRNFLVCIDDLERRESDLSPSGLLGLIANLRDQRHCKVVLLYNENVANDDPELAKALAEYREKVIDREITLEPTVEDCYTLVFGANYTFDTPLVSKADVLNQIECRSLLGLFQAAGVANIRIMRKTRDALDYFFTGFGSRYPKQWPLFARQLTKLCILHFVHGHTVQVAEVSKKDIWIRLQMERRKKKEEETEAQKHVSATDPLAVLAYQPYPSDLLTVEYLTKGHAEFAPHTKMFDETEKYLAFTDVRRRLYENWDKLWSNFQMPQDAYVSLQVDFLNKYAASSLSFSDIAQVVVVLRDLGGNPEAEKIMEREIVEFVAKHNGSDSELHLPLTTVPDVIAQEVRKRISTRPIEPKQIAVVVESIAGSNGWNSKEIDHVLMYDEAAIMQWLTSSTHSELLGRIKIFRQRMGGDVRAKPFMDRLDATLHKLAARSKIDEFRVYNGTGLERPQNASSADQS